MQGWKCKDIRGQDPDDDRQGHHLEGHHRQAFQQIAGDAEAGHAGAEGEERRRHGTVAEEVDEAVDRPWKAQAPRTPGEARNHGDDHRVARECRQGRRPHAGEAPATAPPDLEQDGGERDEDGGLEDDDHHDRDQPLLTERREHEGDAEHDGVGEGRPHGQERARL